MHDSIQPDCRPLAAWATKAASAYRCVGFGFGAFTTVI